MNKQITRNGTFTLIGFGYFLIAVVALDFLNPEYTLVRSIIANGNYDIGPHEFLIASTYFGLSLGSLALVIGLYQGISRSARSWIGLLLLGIWGVGIFIAGIFPTSNPGSTVPHMTTVLIAGIFPVDVLGYPETIFGYIHILTNLWSFFSLTFAAILLSLRFKQDILWLPIHRLALILSLVMLASLLWIFLLFIRVVNTGFETSTGILVVTSLMWLFLTAARLRFVVAASVSK